MWALSCIFNQFKHKKALFMWRLFAVFAVYSYFGLMINRHLAQVFSCDSEASENLYPK